MADLGDVVRRITVIPIHHPAPGIEDPNPVNNPIVEPTEPVPAETTPSEPAPAEPELVPAE